MAELENVDIVIAEESLRIARDRKASPAVRQQALQTIAGLDMKPKSEADADPLTADSFLADLRLRVRALEAHYGRPILALLGDPEIDFMQEDSRIG